MKVDAKALFEVVRQVVRDEMQRSLPGIVREHLTEQYLRKLTVESATRGAVAVPFSRDKSEDDRIPYPEPSEDQGIYEPDQFGDKADAPLEESFKKQLLSPDNPLSFVYQSVDAPAVQQTKSKPMPVSFDRANRLIEALEKKPVVDSVVGKLEYERKLRELEQRRKELDVPVRGS